MRRSILMSVALCLFWISPAAAAGPKITVMTTNLYLGADLTRILTAAPEDVPEKVDETFQIVQQTDFPARARALAAEVKATRPDLIGLQEAVLWRRQSPRDPTTPATEVVYDFVEILRSELARRGLRYTAVAVRTGFDAELPMATDEGLDDIRLTFRDVILAREGRNGLTIDRALTGDFQAHVVRPSGAGLVVVRRGWALVDATVEGRSFRFVSTHLESVLSGIQLAQASELLAGPLKTDLPVVLVGDFNDDIFFEQTATYAHLTAAGFFDAWLIGGASEGFTCCQQEALCNVISQLTSRIDLVFFDGHFSLLGVDIVGEDGADRVKSAATSCESGKVWPSDHAGVVARLQMAE